LEKRIKNLKGRGRNPNGRRDKDIMAIFVSS